MKKPIKQNPISFPVPPVPSQNRMIPMPSVRVEKTATGYEVMLNTMCLFRFKLKGDAESVAAHVRRSLLANGVINAK